MSLTDCRGVPVSIGDRKALDGLEAAHEEFLCYRGDPVGMIDAVLEAHPDFVMGHCFKAGLLTQAMETRIYDDMVRERGQAAEALADKANDRERGHIEGAPRLDATATSTSAVEGWEAVLVDHPRDLLALQLASTSPTCCWGTPSRTSGTCVARVLAGLGRGRAGLRLRAGASTPSAWRSAATSPGPRSYGRHGDCHEPATTPTPIHAVAHVHGDARAARQGGIWWMTSREDNWARTATSPTISGGTSRCSIWTSARYDRVLNIFDNHSEVSNDPSGDKYEELDATALLWRL